MRSAEVEDRINFALSEPTDTKRLSALLWAYVTAPPQLRDTLFAEVAFRLSAYDDAVIAPTPRSSALAAEGGVALPASFLTRLLALLRRQGRQSRQSGS